MGEGKPNSSAATQTETEPNAGVSQMEQLSSTTDPRSDEQGGTDIQIGNLAEETGTRGQE